MEIDREDTMARGRPPESSFVGDVEVAGYFKRSPPSHLAGALASFGPGSRTPWKSNPLGQTVVIISGVGRVQARGGEIVEVRAGDIIGWAPNEEHWEGASPDEAMSLFAVQEESGGMISFGAAVTDEEYRGQRR